MAFATAPIRSPRRIYKIADLVRRKDTSEGGTGSTIKDGIINMKVSVANLFGNTIEELAYDDPLWYYEREIAGDIIQFRKNLGGYRFKQVKLIKYAGFDIVEKVLNKEEGTYTDETNKFRSFTVGLPSGSSFDRFLTFLEGTDLWESIDKIYSPDGKAVYPTTLSGGGGEG